MQSIGDLLCQIGLNSEHILQVAIVRCAPEPPISTSVVKDRYDFNPIFDPLDGAFQDSANIELGPNLIQWTTVRAGNVFVAKYRAACDDPKIGNSGYLINHLGGKSVAEVLVFLAVAQIIERQHGDGLGSRKGRVGFGSQ